LALTLDFFATLNYIKTMTIKELKSKIEALESALRFPALPNNNAILVDVLKETIIELQAKLIQKLS